MPHTSMPSGTVTFLFAELDEEIHDAEWIGMRNEPGESIPNSVSSFFRQAMEANGGYTYKIVGNSFQVAFPTASQAAPQPQMPREQSVEFGNPNPGHRTRRIVIPHSAFRIPHSAWLSTQV